MDAQQWREWLDAVVDQYNAGQATIQQRDEAQRQYDLAMAELGVTSSTTKQMLTVALVLGGVYIFAKYGRR